MTNHPNRSTENTYKGCTVEGRAVELTPEQVDRWDAGDRGLLAEIAETLSPGDYSIYAPDDGPLLENITVDRPGRAEIAG